MGLELELLRSTLLVSESCLCVVALLASPPDDAPAARRAVADAQAALLRAVDFWATPRRAEAAAARLAALGVERAERAPADVLAALLHTAGNAHIQALGTADVPTLKRIVVVDPFALLAASNLAHNLLDTRRALLVPRRATRFPARRPRRARVSGRVRARRGCQRGAVRGARRGRPLRRGAAAGQGRAPPARRGA
jgi:hypothetical protein